MAEKYSAENIKVLEGLEGVRKRPAMYIGGTDKQGLHHLVSEVLDNSVDEALAGYCDIITVTLYKDGSCSVEDNGRGIPVDIHPTYKVPAVEVALTKLHAGGKFDKDSYKVSGGLHGVGLSCVNALSQKLIVRIKREGKVYEQEYSRGPAVTKLKVVEKCPEKETGTFVQFYPDPQIFSSLEFDFKILQNRFREVAFLNAGLKIILEDEVKDKKEEFHAEGGVMDFVKWLNKSKEPLHAKPIYFKKEIENVSIEIGIQYNSGYQENIFGFVNTINTVEGGTHVSGLKTALTRVINDYVKKKNLLKNGDTLMGEDVREGLTAIVSIKIPEPQFEGQTKSKLGNSEVKGYVDSAVTLFLSEFFEENPSVAKAVIQKSLDSAKARLAAKKAKDLVRRKNAFSLGGLPGKLADCSSRKSDDSELYLVEGESAGGCFEGNTSIPLADGRILSFKDLVCEYGEGKENFCYTIKDDESIGIEKIENPRITKKNVEVIKIVLDNDEEIICTPDHKFMLRYGGYKEAKKLTRSDSLMPLNRKISKIGRKITIEGYEMVLDTNGKWIFTHMLSDRYNMDKGIYSKEGGPHKHHMDFNKLNNNPSNITRLNKEEHMNLHVQNLDKTIHRDDIKEKCRIIRQTPAFRKKISVWAKRPKVNIYMTNKFKEFCENSPKYVELNKRILDKAQREYWSDPKNRKKASMKVKKFFKENPEAKSYLSYLAKKQWGDSNLVIWRGQKTKEQWTPEFRKKRKEAYNKVYYNETLKLMKKIMDENGNLNDFNKMRIKNKNKNALSLETFCNRFFKGNKEEMLETASNWNHKIKRIEKLNEKIDVYDLEVPNTHNFALASGVFVHNSAKNARNKESQAILPLKGKILNVEKANPARALSSEEITNMITAIGTGVGESFDLSKLRYKRIIIMTDADIDGEHIKTLLLTFFFRFMPELIENGHIYVAMPPLFRIRKKKDYYVYTEEELKKVTSGSDSANVTRFKGLGEMSLDQLWDTTMNPKTRKIKKIYIEDAIEADQVFSMLMGDDVQGRKDFIAENAHEAALDI